MSGPRSKLRLRLWQRLFIAFALLSGAVLLGFLAWQQHAFRGAFLDYLDAVALRRLAPSAERLATAYAEHGDWQFLRSAPRRLGDYVELDRWRPRGRPDAAPPPGDVPPPPADLPPPPGDMPPPPPGDMPPPDDAAREPRRGPPRGPPDLMQRLLLVDAQGERVVGNPHVSADAPSIAVMLDGREVGRLRLGRQPELGDAIDSAFARAQARDALIAGLAILALALPLAFALARRLLAPVRALAQATRALADGDYARRVDASRSDELGELAGDFNHLALTLDRNREARRAWGADIAHELRTPLSVLRGEVQALQDGVRLPTPAAFDSLQAECERLGGLVEDLYQLALADAGALEYRFEPLDFAELVQQAAAMQVAGCADDGLALELPAASRIVVRGDARRLAQLVDNLLANARRHTESPGRIRLALSARDGSVRLVVDDTPPGVPSQALPKLFDRLYRVDAARSRVHGGAGLGLAICRAIVDAHEGRIDAQPSPLGGLRIVVELPLAAEGRA
ncbi:two-component system sensor histidine kinase BaeS [Dokdonella fugitiva]|uniref:Signal transduction histidine-protein kinase/phosphatase MprB n=1 Tax=Dokdonella fugitiva TaxID=328517 RepID=A0A839EYB7_9GAMM|nr:ATP-binding protein [Dokdonella fugitiva]MBA8887623.1 two-component system sensor histidine kinase BaeS [Dokdonella fugitiva]